MDLHEITTLVWGSRLESPSPDQWLTSPDDEQSPARWSSLRQAIEYATGMRADREQNDLHPWIRTPQGHVYSPATVDVMAATLDLNRRSQPLASRRIAAAVRGEAEPGV